MSSARVFVGNLPSEVRHNDIEKFFRGYGKIFDIQQKDGYAIVVFTDPLDADKAISHLNGRTLLNNRITVEKTFGSKKRDRFESRRPIQGNQRRYVIQTSHRVFIRNLSSRISWQDLKDYMSTVSQPTFADAHKKFKNEGMVEFSTYEDMNRAIAKLDGTELDGRVIHMIPADRTRGGRRSSPEYYRFTKRKRSASPVTSRRDYARESRPSRRFRSKDRASRFYDKRSPFRSVESTTYRRRPRSQSKSESRPRFVERKTLRSRSRSLSLSFKRPKSPSRSPVQTPMFQTSPPHSSRQSRSKSRSSSSSSRSSSSTSSSRSRSRSGSPSIQRPISGSPTYLSEQSRSRSRAKLSSSKSRSRSNSISEPESKRVKFE